MIAYNCKRLCLLLSDRIYYWQVLSVELVKKKSVHFVSSGTDVQDDSQSVKAHVSYFKLFTLFIIGSLLGIVLEGIHCLYCYGHWETHVVSVWGLFCILYGMGAVIFYACHFAVRRRNRFVQFLCYCAVGFSLELLCGCLLEFGLNMRAWDYTGHFMNIRGHVSPQMTFMWGIIGIVFSLLLPYIEFVLHKIENSKTKIACMVLTVFMAINLSLTFCAFIRWKGRHFDVTPKTSLGTMIDERYNDEYMSERFCEWRFLS